MKKKSIKLEGQDFELGFMLAHANAESFVAQCKKQKLFADRGDATQTAMLTALWNDATALQKANAELPTAVTAPAASTNPADKYAGWKKGRLTAELRKRKLEFEETADEPALVALLVANDTKPPEEE